MTRKFRPYLTGNKKPYSIQGRRIVLPQIPKRPIRFQTRTLIRQEFIHPDPWWFIVHRRGIPRPKVGIDALEARAAPKSIARGPLDERIIYQYLVEKMNFIPGIDFIHQSSLEGGHLQLGGIVADFLFPILMVVLNPLGPTHDEYIRIRKDEEQNQALEEMGYTVYMIPEKTVYDEYAFEDFMRGIFGWLHNGGPDEGHDFDPNPNLMGFSYQRIKNGILDLGNVFNG